MGGVLPFTPKHPCKTIGCSQLTSATLCNRCEENGIRIDNRPSAKERGYDGRWQDYRRRFLESNPYCADPYGKHKARVLATIVDHVIPHEGNPNVFWDFQNHMSLCKPCHDYKTAKFDGGFGRARVGATAPDSVPFSKTGGGQNL